MCTHSEELIAYIGRKHVVNPVFKSIFDLLYLLMNKFQIIVTKLN